MSYTFRDAIIHLQCIDTVGSASIHKVIAWACHERAVCLSELLRHDAAFLRRLTSIDFEACGISSSTARAITIGLQDMTILETEYALCGKNDVTICVVGDEEYPPQLLTIHTPPAVLWCQGPYRFKSRHCALVGSRSATPYGKRVVASLVMELVKHDIVIVSGGAHGIDATAHEKALEYGGITVVVAGAGLLCPYPPEHAGLFASAAEKGAVLSPFPMRTHPSKGTFPARNRIIAGLAPITVVVQASAKSGALITAQYALEEGRDVAVVPGCIDDPLSAGPLRLAQQGAALIMQPADLLVLLGFERSDGLVKTESADTLHPLVALLASGALFFDEIVVASGGDPRDVQQQLMELAIQGLVLQTITGKWQRC